MLSTVIHGEGLSKRSTHYHILDALRFVLALWVAISHFGIFPLFAGVDVRTTWVRLLAHGWNTVVFGAPAVIVFFVISGFCIHLPFIRAQELPIGRYYLRRYTRILIPVAGALCVYRLFGERLLFRGEHSVLWDSPLWSLACEEIYYAVYPLLRLARNFFGWKWVLPVSFVVSVLIYASHPQFTEWYHFGPFGTALLLLPVWLLGCLLAEQGEALVPRQSLARVWSWRFLAWLGSWITNLLQYRVGIPMTVTMPWFGLLAYFWVREEISYGKHRNPNRYLAAAGAWSYSLYLMHIQGLAIPSRLGMPNLGYILNWFLTMFSALAFAYVFFFLIEKPSHALARKIRVSRAPRSAVAEKPVTTSGSASVHLVHNSNDA